MDKKIENLHTAARRYCLEYYSYWSEKYSQIRRSDLILFNYTEEELNIFPRYNVLNAILEETERFTPADFSTLQEAKEILMEIGATANNIFTRASQEETVVKVMQEEREKFNQFISGYSEDKLLEVEPLFYRRVLRQEESNHHWQKLKDRWKATKDKYYYPLSTMKPDKSLIAFQDEYFEQELGFRNLQEILKSHQVDTIWELRETGGLEYEIELSIFEPVYNASEGYWCSEGYDWLIYASHESSITVGGQWLIEEMKKVWPNWEKRIWGSPFFD